MPLDRTIDRLYYPEFQCVIVKAYEGDRRGTLLLGSKREVQENDASHFAREDESAEG